MTVFEETCLHLTLHMTFEVGDIEFLFEAHVLYARAEYKDFLSPPTLSTCHTPVG